MKLMLKLMSVSSRKKKKKKAMNENTDVFLTSCFNIKARHFWGAFFFLR